MGQNGVTLHKFDARVKLLIGLIFAVTIVTLKTITLLTVAFSLSLGALLLARVTIRQAFLRLMPVLSFLIPVMLILPLTTPGHEVMSVGMFSVTIEGIIQGSIISLRMVSILFIFTSVINSIGRQSLLATLLQLKVPGIFIQVAEFALRYIEVLAQESKSMLIARRSRAYQKSRFFTLKDLQEIGNLIGMLFIRSYARAERIYIAMLSRGYSAEMVSNAEAPLKPADIALSTGILLTSLSLVLIDRGGINLWI